MAGSHRYRDMEPDMKSMIYGNNNFSENVPKQVDLHQKEENRQVRSKVAAKQSSTHRQPIANQSSTTMEATEVAPKEPTPQTIPTNTCADCNEDLDDSLHAETKCGHFFHIICLLTLLQKTDKCPSCQKEISASEDWNGRHIPCGKKVDKSELLWNDVQHLWIHKDCRFSNIEVLHLTNPDFMRNADNPSSSSNSVTDNKGAYAKPRERADMDSRGSSEKKKSISEMDNYYDNMLPHSFGLGFLNVPPKIGTSGRMTVKPVVPKPDNFDKIFTSLNSFDSDFFSEPLTIEHRPLFESTDEFDLPNETSEQSKNNEDVCKFCDERFDSSHQPTTVTICGHLLHTHCMNKYLPTKKQCPVCDHAINWVDVTNKCVFCLESFNWNGDMYVSLPCDHKSHQNCHKLWMCTTNDCPICKETIYSRDGCSICLKPVLPSQIKRKSKCGHEYHAKCSNYEITESDCRTCDRINGATSVTCTICFDYIKKETKSKPISCKHEFHNNCLKRWLQNKTNCPLCRSPID